MLWQTQGNIGAFLKKRNKTAVPMTLFQKPKERQSELQASSHHRIGTVRYRSVCTVGDENGFQAMKMAFKDFLNKIIVSIWCQET